jgi:uncharacterized protein YdgA (DUF945 family)
LKREAVLKKIVSIVIVLVLIFGIAWAGSSWWFGRQVENQFQQIAKQTASVSGAKIDIEEYQRGWLGATARTRITFSMPVPVTKGSSPSPPLSLIVLTRIVNGPFPGGPAGLRPAMALIRSRVALGPELLKLARREWPAFPNELPVTSTTVVYIGGNGESWSSAPPFHQRLSHPEPTTLDWQGFSGHSTFSAGFKKCRGNLRMPALEVMGKPGRMRLAGLEATFDLNLPQGLGGQMLGDVDYSVKSLEVAADGAPKDKRLQVALQDVDLKGSSRQTDGLINGTLRASFRKLTVNGAVNGPGVYDMKISNLDAAALNELRQASRQLGSEKAGLSPEALQAQTLAAVSKIWPRIASRSPVLEIRELSLEAPDGHLRCSARIAVDGSKKEALENPMRLPEALSADASVEVSAPLLRKVLGAVMRQKLVKAQAASGQPPLPDQQLDALVAASSEQAVAALVEKHLLVPKDGTYTLTASYRPVEATLNGQPIPMGR